MQPNAALECPAAALPLFTVLPPETPTSTVLRAARDLISEPERWTKWGYSFAEKPLNKTAALRTQMSTFDEASCFCSWGALLALRGRNIDNLNVQDAVTTLLTVIREHTEFTNIPSFNDDPETTHADVLRMFNRAINKAEGLEAREASLALLQ